jgi:hypothetical protein
MSTADAVCKSGRRIRPCFRTRTSCRTLPVRPDTARNWRSGNSSITTPHPVHGFMKNTGSSQSSPLLNRPLHTTHATPPLLDLRSSHAHSSSAPGDAATSTDPTAKSASPNSPHKCTFSPSPFPNSTRTARRIAASNTTTTTPAVAPTSRAGTGSRQRRRGRELELNRGQAGGDGGCCGARGARVELLVRRRDQRRGTGGCPRRGRAAAAAVASECGGLEGPGGTEGGRRCMAWHGGYMGP